MKVFIALILLTSYGMTAERSEANIITRNGIERRHSWLIWDISKNEAVGDDIQDDWLLEAVCEIIAERINP